MKDHGGQGPVALVVDDHEAVRHALCERILVSFSHCRLREASSVDAALKIVDSERVDVVLMDIHLPGMNGVEGTRAVRAHSPHTSVVVVSAYNDQSHRAAADQAGAAAYICKRSINKDLIPVLANLMNCGTGMALAPA